MRYLVYADRRRIRRMDDAMDKTAPVRQGEELDAEALKSYFRENLPGFSGELSIEQFPAGHSNLTYMIKTDDKELVLRRPPFGSEVKTAHDMGREYKVLSAICDVYDKAPRPLLFCEDESVIGAKFYVMERIKGVVLRRELPEGIDLSPDKAGDLCESFIRNLVEIHSIDFNRVGLGDMGKPKGYLHRQVHGWSGRYYDSQTDDIAEVEEVITWLKDNIPESPPPTLVHNDYKYDNLIIAPGDITKIIGVLDWEMSTIGDPLTDLGTSLGYWVQADDPPELLENAFGPTYVPGSYTRRQLVDRYAELTGTDVTDIHYYLCFALFKIAVIIQQIYYRFAKGHTQDQRFGPMIDYVKLLARTSNELIEREQI